MKKMKLFSDKEFYSKLWNLALPIALQNLMLALVAAADALMLGRVDQNTMSAVSLATQIQFIQNMVLGSIVSGIVVLGAQYWGKGDKKTINDLFCMGLRLAGIVQISDADLHRRRSADPDRYPLSADRRLVLSPHRDLPVLSGHHEGYGTCRPGCQSEYRRCTEQYYPQCYLYLRAIWLSGNERRRGRPGYTDLQDPGTGLGSDLLLPERLHTSPVETAVSQGRLAGKGFLPILPSHSGCFPGLGHWLYFLFCIYGTSGNRRHSSKLCSRSGTGSGMLPVQRTCQRRRHPGWK